jgi:hypothetical protein
VTRPPPGTRPAPTEPPITVEPAPTTAPPAPPTTAATTSAPTTAEPPPDPPVEPPSEPAKTAQVLDPPPTISKPKVVSLDADRASVSYSSDHCVATRFRLSGSDGSRQTGSSDGYDAAVHCSTAWNLDFVGASGLVPGVSYGLTVWVKSVAGQTARDSVSFTTPS